MAPSGKLHKPGPVVDKKAAVQYYFSKARYSPLTSGSKKGEGGLRQASKVGFGSSAPRWPAESLRHKPSFLRDDSKSGESAKLWPQPVLSGTKPRFGYLPSYATKGSSTNVSGKKDALPSVGGFGHPRVGEFGPPRVGEFGPPRVGEFGPPREAHWKPVLQQRPTVVSGTTYHSSITSSKRHGVHGRTDWSSK